MSEFKIEGETLNLRELARELLDAEEANRMAPTMQNQARLARARRRIEEALEAG